MVLEHSNTDDRILFPAGLTVPPTTPKQLSLRKPPSESPANPSQSQPLATLKLSTAERRGMYRPLEAVLCLFCVNPFRSVKMSQVSRSIA
jgi:hypothetical protein